MITGTTRILEHYDEYVMRNVDPFLSFFILESYLLKQKKSRERFVCSGKMYTVILKLGSLKFGEQFLMLDDM